MPFLGAPSKYLILDSNITGGSPNLIVNGGVNNMALGNFVLTTHETGDNNIAIGNGALTDDQFGFNNVAVGFSAKRLRINADGTGNGSSSNNSVFIGNNAAGEAFTNYSGSVIIGSNAGQIPAGELNNDNVIIGADAGVSENPLNATASRNVIIGASAAQDVNNQPQENVVIGAEAAINTTLKNANLIVGYAAAQGGFGDFNRNTIIGNQANQKNTNFDLITTEEITVIGYQAAYGTNYGIDNTLIGYQAGLSFDETGAVAGANPSTNNIVLGKKSLYWSSGTGTINDPQYNDNIIIGNNSASNLDNIGSDIDPVLTNNIIIGSNSNTAAVADLSFSNSIIIGNNLEIPNSVNGNIIIGDPSGAYDSILIGGVDLLALSGGFGAVAFQDAATDVSITSVASDLVSGFSANYTFVANTDNATAASSLGAFQSTNGTIDNNALMFTDLESSSVELNLTDGTDTVSSSYTGNIINKTMQVQLNATNGLTNCGLGLSVDAASDVARYEVTGATIVNEWTVPAQTGASAADFTPANAPAAISVSNWIAVTLNGVAGYIPFLSTPI